MSGGPFGVPTAGDFHCGRCGTLLDGGTDEPVAARKLRVAVAEAVAFMRNAGPASDPNAWHAFMEKHETRNTSNQRRGVPAVPSTREESREWRTSSVAPKH